MNTFAKKTVIGVMAASILASIVGSLITANGPAPAQPVQTTLPVPAPDEAFEGNADAPVTIIEYSSMGCSHCADFRLNHWPALKADYVDTGKVRVIARDFPLDLPSARAAAALRCVAAARPGEEANALRDTLFRRQAAWQTNSEDDLNGVLRSEGFDVASEANKNCMKAEFDTVLKARQTGQIQHGVNATPMFFVGADVVRGGNVDLLVKAITRNLAGQKAGP